MKPERPEAVAFRAAMRRWEYEGRPQSGPAFDNLNRKREEFLAATRRDSPKDSTGERVNNLRPKGPGPR